MTVPPQPVTPPWVKVLIICVIVVGLLMVVGVGSCIYLFSTQPKLRKVGTVISETMRMGIGMAYAPGSAELREIGCSQAVIVDPRRMQEVIRKLDPDKAERKPSMETPVVLCQVTLASQAADLSCERVARVYQRAVEAVPDSFRVMVKAQFPPRVLCNQIFGDLAGQEEAIESERTDADGVGSAAEAQQPEADMARPASIGLP